MDRRAGINRTLAYRKRRRRYNITEDNVGQTFRINC
jgi:hypothetical protein